MSYLAIILVLLSAFLHSLKSLLIKSSVDKQVFLWWYATVGAVLYFPVFLFFYFKAQTPINDLLIYGGTTSIIHFFYCIFFAKSYEHGDLSLVYPIMRASPALVLIFAVLFLGESVTLLGGLGVFLIVFGVYIINMKKLTLSEIKKPIFSVFKNRSTKYAFLTMLTVAAYSVFDKVGAEKIHPIVFGWTLTFMTLLLFTPYVFFIKKNNLFKEEWRVNKKSILINSVIAQGGYLLILIAFTFEKVSYVASLRQLSIVFAVLMGSHILKEEGKNIRLLASVIIFIGAFLIATAE